MFNPFLIILCFGILVCLFFAYTKYKDNITKKKFEEIYLFIYENFDKDMHDFDLVNCNYNRNNMVDIIDFFYMKGYTNVRYYDIDDLYTIFNEFKNDKIYLKDIAHNDVLEKKGLYSIASKDVMNIAKKERYILFSEKCKHAIIRNKAKMILHSQFNIKLELEPISKKDNIIEEKNNFIDEINPLEKEVIDIIEKYK